MTPPPDSQAEPAYANSLGLVQAARAAQAKNDWAEAGRLWLYVVAVNQDYLEAWRLAALALRRQQFRAEAEVLLKKAVERFPDDSGLALTRGWNLMELRDWPQAERAWQDVIARFPDLSDGYSGMMFLYRSANRIDECEALVTAAVPKFPAHVQLQFGFAVIPALRKDWPLAVARLAAFAKLFPESTEHVPYLADALRFTGRAAEADAFLQTMRDKFPDHVNIATLYAHFPSHEKNWSEVERRWQAVRDQMGPSPKIMQGLADALIAQKRFSAAVEVLSAAVQAFPAEQALAEALAGVFGAAGEWQKAEQQWAEVAQQFPASAAAGFGRAQARLKSGDSAGAEELASLAVKSFPSHIGVHSLYATIAADAKNWEAAERRWAALREVAPNHANAWVQQAKALRQLGQAEQAAALLADGVKRFPADHNMMAQWIECLVARGAFDEALDILFTSLASAPDDQRLKTMILDLASRTGNPAHMEKAVAINSPPVPAGTPRRAT
jgi:tetratricopeptide (TPR) repeat protein